ncbi:MAG: DUF6787 family protein [Flavobacteriales bacterium]|jgi:hypothetical protein|tara:strand:- start:6873 stop:7199 length:327 start_codon:yes stop_codon:yes gene_type:complete
MIWYNKLKIKWEIKSDFSLVLILVVFAITGSSSLLVAEPILNYFNFTEITVNPYVYYPLRIILIFPIYQILLLIIGGLFCQFNFFWQFEKKMLSKLGFRKFFKNQRND